MKYDDLWPESLDDGYVSTENISEIMRSQANYLKKKTQGNVFLKFGHIKSVNPFTAASSAAAALMTTTQLSTEYLGNTNVNTLKDANKLYSQKRFGCEIHNQSYRFRLFEMDYPPLYPITAYIDEGIVSDIKEQYSLETFEQNALQVDNDSEFLELLKSIFASKKVAYILNRLMEDD